MSRIVFYTAVGLMWGGVCAFAQPAGQQVIGARPAALGEAFVAIADDGYAAYWNPAGLPFLRSQELNSTRADLFGTGLESTYLAYAIPFTDRYAAGFDFLHTGFGDEDEELSFAQNRLGVSSGFRFFEWLAVGASAKWFSLDAGLEGIGNPADFSSTGSGWGFDLGLLAEPRPGLRIGAMAQDLFGTQIRYGNGVERQLYPAQLRLGAAYRLRRELLLSSGVDEAAHLGAEYQLHPVLRIRGGMQWDLEESVGVGYALGLGLRHRFVALDYALTQSPGLGETHRFSLGLAFNLSASAIKIQDLDLQPVFPALQKRYTHQPLGRIKLTNTSRKPLETTLSLFIPEAMEQPTELSESVVLAPGTETVDLFALFGSRLSTWGRNRLVPAEVQVRYTEGNRTRSAKKHGRVTIYKRNAIQWESIGAAAAFITPEDEVVSAFASGVLQTHAEAFHQAGRASRPLLRAMLLFDALGQHGVRYLADPNTPFEQIAGREFIVDSIQYPPELLQKRSGDCDDCTVLYCSLLENIGIPTALVEAPGHILMAFDTGVNGDEAEKIGLVEGYYLEREGRLWVPVEVTLFGQSFHQAWRGGVEECLRLEEEGRLVAVDTREAWKSYPPSPPRFEVAVAAPEKQALAPLFGADWQELRKVQEDFLQRTYLDTLAVRPEALSLQEAFLYSLFQLGEYGWALAHLDSLEERKAPLHLVENNRAIAYILQGELDRAEASLKRVLETNPQDEEALHKMKIVQSRRGEQSTAAVSGRSPKAEGQRGEEEELSVEELILKQSQRR